MILASSSSSRKQNNNFNNGSLNNNLLPKEAAIVEEYSADLEETFTAMLRALAECVTVRKNTYLSQLRKAREISNMATRNAIQVIIFSYFRRKREISLSLYSNICNNIYISILF